MKIIDLLNKIAKGEIPKRIIYDDKQWTYDEKIEDYITYDDSRIDWKYTIMEYINDEIEIIEEDKKIEKLPNVFGISEYKDVEQLAWEVEKRYNEIVHKFDELIDKVNSLENKQ